VRTDRRSEPVERVLGRDGRRGSLDAWRQVWRSREVVRAFAVRSLRIRYRQAFLGALWVIAQPILLLIPFTLFLDRAGGEPRQASLRAATLAALVGWQYLSSAVTAGSGALVGEAMLVRKTWFPREAPVVAAVGSSAVELLIGLLLALTLGPILGARPGLSLVTLPLLVVGLAIVALAVALPLAALNAVFRDVRHALPFGVLLWLFASPVAYPVDRVDGSWRMLYAIVNPAVGPLDGMRRVLALGVWPDFGLLATSICSALVIGTLGHRLFCRFSPTIADLI
jgi:ABC-type polysaccharide/polyol phosphate export permease